MPTSPAKRAAIVAVGVALLGLIFSGYSTYDYAQQLDRQVHAVHCSFIPGAPVSTDADNPCKTALFSPYSALFRATWWGGVPVSVFGVGAFGFFAAFGVYLALGARSRRAHPFYAVATLAPLGASLVMFFISAVHLHVFCKLCVGIYVASFALAAAAVVAWNSSRRELLAFAPTAPSDPRGSQLPREGWGKVVLWLAGLGVAVLLPAAAYVGALPNVRPLIDKCGTLPVATESHNSLLKIPTAHPVRPVLLFEDPLCPTCKAFHERLVDEGVFEKLDVTMALFPLDTECNWMLDRPLHPGACILAKAVLCGGNDKARSILEWSFDNQEDLRELGKKGAAALTSKVEERWGSEIAACIAKPQTTVRLNQQLHFAANNHIPVSTPQMFLGNKRICDEDTDLGLKYTLAQLAPGGLTVNDSKPRAAVIGMAVGAALVLIATASVAAMVHGAKMRLEEPAAQQAVAVADDAEVAYCTPAFKQVLQRVINACGLAGGTEQRRGCQPADVKTFASINDDDFNALFTPLKDRGAVVMFDENAEVLDPGAKQMLDERWQDRRGARYFFIVARASRDGTTEGNRALSHKRANSVAFYLKEATSNPNLDKEVGMLWLGSEFAQLPKTFCDWPNSRHDKPCTPEAINRSAFVSWVDCRL